MAKKRLISEMDMTLAEAIATGSEVLKRIYKAVSGDYCVQSTNCYSCNGNYCDNCDKPMCGNADSCS